ncbi:hypothetical protein BDZ97DRAFT_1929729 [Flammula alnicola]|nr:hypothetical protein BDZ97DRAFT_1929729 [Flammula alnicola]
MPHVAANKSEKAVKPCIPDINWAANKSSLIWGLLAEIEKDVNYRVLYGKKDTAGNTSGETKVTIYNRIAEATLLDMFALDPSMVHDHVKKQIEKEFVFFPMLHCIFASCPNVTPIIVTTALGLQGQKTVWYQPPDDNGNIDPKLLKESVTLTAGHLTPQREWSFGNDAAAIVNANVQGPKPASQGMENIDKSKTPGPQRGLKPSSASHDAFENSRKVVTKLPQKRSLADTLMEIQRENLTTQKAQNQNHINLELHKQIIDKLKAGLWTIEQAQERI